MMPPSRSCGRPIGLDDEQPELSLIQDGCSSAPTDVVNTFRIPRSTRRPLASYCELMPRPALPDSKLRPQQRHPRWRPSEPILVPLETVDSMPPNKSAQPLPRLSGVTPSPAVGSGIPGSVGCGGAGTGVVPGAGAGEGAGTSAGTGEGCGDGFGFRLPRAPSRSIASQ